MSVVVLRQIMEWKEWPVRTGNGYVRCSSLMSPDWMGDRAHMFKHAGSWSEQVTFLKQPPRIELFLWSVTNSNSSGTFCVTLVTMCSLLITDTTVQCALISKSIVGALRTHIHTLADVKMWAEDERYTDSYNYNNLSILISVQKNWCKKSIRLAL